VVGGRDEPHDQCAGKTAQGIDNEQPPQAPAPDGGRDEAGPGVPSRECRDQQGVGPGMVLRRGGVGDDRLARRFIQLECQAEQQRAARRHRQAGRQGDTQLRDRAAAQAGQHRAAPAQLVGQPPAGQPARDRGQAEHGRDSARHTQARPEGAAQQNGQEGERERAKLIDRAGGDEQPDRPGQRSLSPLWPGHH